MSIRGSQTAGDRFRPRAALRPLAITMIASGQKLIVMPMRAGRSRMSHTGVCPSLPGREQADASSPADPAPAFPLDSNTGFSQIPAPERALAMARGGALA
jgi:hypothetical protein